MPVGFESLPPSPEDPDAQEGGAGGQGGGDVEGGLPAIPEEEAHAQPQSAQQEELERCDPDRHRPQPPRARQIQGGAGREEEDGQGEDQNLLYGGSAHETEGRSQGPGQDHERDRRKAGPPSSTVGDRRERQEDGDFDHGASVTGSEPGDAGGAVGVARTPSSRSREAKPRAPSCLGSMRWDAPAATSSSSTDGLNA